MPGQRIFISYRRDDSKYPAALLHERLISAFGRDRVFMDISDIPFGVNFREHIREQMRDSALCIALIGPRWLELLQQRADDTRDFVRIELEMAHELGVPVIPVTLDEAEIPGQQALPESLHPLHLSDINSQPIRGGADLSSDLDRLVAGLATLLPEYAAQVESVPAAAESPAARAAGGSGQRWGLILLALLAIGIGGWWLLNQAGRDAGEGAAPPAERTGSPPQQRLEVVSVPATAMVEINGEPMGGRRSFDLPRGEYRVAIRAEGHVPQEHAVDLSVDRRLQVELEAQHFVLTLRSNVRGDRAFVDGRAVGSTRADVELPAGPHEVVIEKDGYVPFSTLVDLREDTTVRAELLRRDQVAPGRPPRSPEVVSAAEARTDSFRDPLRDAGNGPLMQLVPAGRFVMGSPDRELARTDAEGPQHEVEVAAFALGAHEVTVDEFAHFIESSGYVTEAERGSGCEVISLFGHRRDGDANWREPGYPQGEDFPVVCVTRNDALAYIDWLNAQAGGGYRLPSEAEWEYAARAGSAAERWWGDAADAACGFANVLDAAGRIGAFAAHDCNDQFAHAAPVGSFRPNAFGLFDMLGNVWEWTADCWHADYRGAPDHARPWLQRGDCEQGLLRGGGWESSPDFVRSARRLARVPGLARHGSGFRVAKTIGR